MAQVTIVGVEGSGKTVLMTAMGALYERPDTEGYFLSPENPAAFDFVKMQMDIMRNGQWPAATLTDSLRYLNWSLFKKSTSGPQRIAELSFLDFAGEIYRLAFGDHDKSEKHGFEDEISALQEHIKKADVLITLINLSDIINGTVSNYRTRETMWLTKAILDFTQKNGNAKHTAIVFSQADTYKDIINDLGGPEKTLQKYLPHVANMYDNCPVFAVSAVDKTTVDNDGIMIPSSDFTSSGIKNLITWIIDSTVGDILAIKKEALSLLNSADFKGAYSVALQGDLKDPEILYILGRCSEEDDVYKTILYPGHEIFPAYGLCAIVSKWCGNIGNHDAMKYYAKALEKDKSGKIRQKINERKSIYDGKIFLSIFFWPISYFSCWLNGQLDECHHFIICGFFLFIMTITNFAYMFATNTDFSHTSRILGLVIGYCSMSLVLWLITFKARFFWDGKLQSVSNEKTQKKE